MRRITQLCRRFLWWADIAQSFTTGDGHPVSLYTLTDKKAKDILNTLEKYHGYDTLKLFVWSQRKHFRVAEINFNLKKVLAVYYDEYLDSAIRDRASTQSHTALEYAVLIRFDDALLERHDKRVNALIGSIKDDLPYEIALLIA
jgi:hypothetical protein